MNEILNWKIDKDQLVDYSTDGWIDDYFIASPNNEYGIVVYNIQEWKMGAESGLIGLFSNQENPQLILNSSRTRIWFNYGKTFDFLEKSDCIVCKIPANDPNKIGEGFPFVLINPKKEKFAFFDFDNTSIYYGLEEMEKNKARLIEIHPIELNNSKTEKRTNEIIDFENLNWLNFVDFDRALEKYYE